nr:MAG TPA: hypothetical protein [Microviridae sp.]
MLAAIRQKQIKGGSPKMVSPLFIMRYDTKKSITYQGKKI